MKILIDFLDFSYLSLFGDLYGHGDRTGKRELPWSRKREYINKGRNKKRSSSADVKTKIKAENLKKNSKKLKKIKKNSKF